MTLHQPEQRSTWDQVYLANQGQGSLFTVEPDRERDGAFLIYSLETEPPKGLSYDLHDDCVLLSAGTAMDRWEAIDANGDGTFALKLHRATARDVYLSGAVRPGDPVGHAERPGAAELFRFVSA